MTEANCFQQWSIAQDLCKASMFHRYVPPSIFNHDQLANKMIDSNQLLQLWCVQMPYTFSLFQQQHYMVIVRTTQQKAQLSLG